MCSHLFFPTISAYSADILEAWQRLLSSAGLKVFCNPRNFRFHFYCFGILNELLGFATVCRLHRRTACYLQMGISWDCAGMMVSRIRGWTVCQSAPCRDVCLRLPCSVSFLFPSGASQIVSARQQLYVPQREPKYLGNQASFSL